MAKSSNHGGISFSVTQTLTCPNCPHEFEATVWLIVDTNQRPDLLERIRGGQLHELPCPHCGETGEVDAPLLVYRPEAESPLLFSPASQTSGEQAQEHAIQLVGALRQSLGEAWRDDWLAQGLHGVSRDALPALLSDDPEAALAELRAKLAGPMHSSGGGPDMHAEFRTDVQQANEGVQRYESRGDAAGLDAAAAAWERIVEHPGFVGSDARFQLGVLNDAAGVFLRRYWARGRLDDLNRALALWWQAVQLTPPDSPDLPMYLNNLGNGLRSRYARTGRLEDLEEAIRVSQQAVQRTPPDSPDLPSRLNNLGYGLSDRYARTGCLEDWRKRSGCPSRRSTARRRTRPTCPDY
jgi:tetratricopeptide (TPR) repeat protein